MGDGTTNIAGIEIPSTHPAFLAVVGVHILLGLACVIAGALAMLSEKRHGRHPRFGTIYFCCLAGVFFTAMTLAAVRWAEDAHLFLLGTLSFASAYLGRRARRQGWDNWARWHVIGMGGILHLPPNGLLCRQWQEPAALEGASNNSFLAVACGRRDTTHHPYADLASGDVPNLAQLSPTSRSHL